MPHVDEDAGQDIGQEPLRVSILRQGGHLVASIHTALDDGQLVRFRRELLDEIGRYRAHGVVIDVAALDVIVREAGGTFTDIDGTPGPAGGSALATNGRLHPDVLTALAPREGRAPSE